MPAIKAGVVTSVSPPLLQTRIAKISSGVLRLVTYFFLRWALLPGLPALVFALFAVYVPTLIWAYFTEPKYEIVDETDITVAEEEGPEVTIIDGRNGAVAKVAETHTAVAVEEKIATRERPLNPWQALLTGAPNPRSLVISALPLLVNVLCVGMVADRLFREHYYTADDLSFVRIGYISDTEAKLFIREPDQAKMPVTIQIHVKDPQPPFDNPLWQTAGGVQWTSNETDYTAVVTVPLRFSKQRTYEWKSSNNHSGEFTAPPKAGRVSDLQDGQFTFLSTSCIVSRLPYNPLDHPLSIPGMRYLAKALPSLHAQFMLFLGDFIYVDVPHQWGKDKEDYRQKYRQVYASPEWKAVGQNLSWIHVIDDHEISNDWSANSTGVYKAAMEPWRNYHAAANPPQAKRAGALSARPEATYYEFTQGPASFFLLDTRSYRSNNLLPSNDTDKTMLGQAQLVDLLSFLGKAEPKGVKWKIIASSVPFTKNWHVNTIDTWGGFLAERKRVLEAMWDAAARGYGVVILSGDRHEFAATKFPPPKNSTWPESATVYEFSASPLSQFYSPIPSYRQTDGEDVAIKYINKGNSKFGAITIESHEQGDQSTLKYRLFVDGVEIWNTVVLSPAAVVDEKSGSFWNRFKFNYSWGAPNTTKSEEKNDN